MLEKSAITQVPVADLIARRWSPRAIDPKRPVSHEQLLALLEAAAGHRPALVINPGVICSGIASLIRPAGNTLLTVWRGQSRLGQTCASFVAVGGCTQLQPQQ
jgi:hypothetical protein